MAIPTGWNALGFTSGRRTYLGNRRVGGVANSDHLNGTAADFTASPAALRAQFGSGVHILDEGDHRHVSGLSDVPYFGRNGTAGLVNGIDTSAPKGNSMISPRKPKPPVVPQMADVPLGIEGSQPIDMPVDLGGIAPAPHVKKGGLFGSGLSLGEALVYGLNGYLAGIGNQAGASNLDMMFGRAKIDDERNFAREQLAAKIAADREERMAKAMEPPAFVRNAQAFAQLSPEQKAQVGQYYDVTNPIVADVARPDGSVFRQQFPRNFGPQTQEVDGVTYYNINGKWYDNPEGR